MCIAPTFVWVQRGPGWEKQETICRKCWRCRKNRVNDYVGRCLAEAAYSDWVCALTLTYAPPEGGGDRPDLAEKVLTPSHFQDFVRSLRDRRHKVRYLVAGEYGTLRGRAHFHTLLFGKGDRPKIPHKENWHIAEWPHGHVFADWSADERAIRYVCKYLLADEDLPEAKRIGKNIAAHRWFSCSKKPQLGAAFFHDLARQHARLEVYPRAFRYQPPAGSKTRDYIMTGATRRDYMRALFDEIEKTPKLRRSLSEWCLKSLEKVERWQHDRDARQWLADQKNEAEYIEAVFHELHRREWTEAEILEKRFQDLVRKHELYAKTGAPTQGKVAPCPD